MSKPLFFEYKWTKYNANQIVSMKFDRGSYSYFITFSNNSTIDVNSTGSIIELLLRFEEVLE